MLGLVVAASCVDASRDAQADKFMALAKESESFDEYSIEKRGSSVRLEKQIGQFQCSFCSEETDFYDVRGAPQGEEHAEREPLEAKY